MFYKLLLKSSLMYTHHTHPCVSYMHAGSRTGLANFTGQLPSVTTGKGLPCLELKHI